MMVARCDRETPDAAGHLDTVARLLAAAILRRRLRVFSRAEAREKSLEVSRLVSAHAIEPESRCGESA